MLKYGEQKGERKRARHLASQKRRQINAIRAEQLSRCPSSQQEAAARWDTFYQTKPTLFKDRHILREAFPELLGDEAVSNPKKHIPKLEPASSFSDDVSTCDSKQSSNLATDLAEKVRNANEEGCHLILLEAGCGGGNAVYPVLRANSRLFALAFDFSQEAITVAKASSEYQSGRIHAFQADLTEPRTFLDILRNASPRGADFVTAFWTLSALPSPVHQIAANGLAAALGEGGSLFFRDYASGDMRQEKFLKRGQIASGDETHRLFLRGDGTYAYFFEAEELRTLFETAGLICESCDYEERVVQNRKDNIEMRRRWLQASFKKPGSHTPR